MSDGTYWLSTNLRLSELDCHDGTAVPVSKIGNAEAGAREVFQPIRTKWNAPIIVVSGYRTLAWNRSVGGAKTSTHLFDGDDFGIDIKPVYGADVRRLHDLILVMWKAKLLPALGGLGLYKNWVHVDNRRAPDGHLRRWNGNGVGAEK